MKKRMKLFGMLVLIVFILNQTSTMVWADASWDTHISDSQGVDIEADDDHDQYGVESVRLFISGERVAEFYGNRIELPKNTSIDGTLGVTETANLSGGITADNFSVADGTGNTSIGGTLQISGTTTLNSTLNANGATNNIGTTRSSTNNIGTYAGSSTTLGNTTGVTGITGNTVSINTSDTAGLDTDIGSTNGDAGTVILKAGTNNIAVSTTSNTITGTTAINGTTSVTGITNINTTGTSATTIGNSGAGAGNVTLQAGGSAVTTRTDAITALTTDGSGLNINNNGTVSLKNSSISGAGLIISGTGDTVSLLNDVGGGHGIYITADTTTISGGTHSSSWTLGDDQATLGVGTATGPEVILITASNDGTNTSVVIGDTGTGSILTVNQYGTTVGNNSQDGVLSLANNANNNNSIRMSGENGSLTLGNTGEGGDLNIVNSDNSNTFAVAGQTGTVTVGNGTDTAGTINLSSTSTSNTISLTGATATGTFGNDTNAGTLYVQNGVGANTVALNGTGDSIITNGASFYSRGTTSAPNGSSVVIKDTSVEATSADGYTNMTLDNGGATFMVQDTGTGNWHGVDVNQNQERTIVSGGGTNASTFTLNDRGATFANERTGGPIRVTGVADGQARYDAVNYGQLKKAYSGIASVAALAAIPDPPAGKTVTVGVGYGHYMGQDAAAIGGKINLFKESKVPVTITGGWAYSNEESTLNAGIGLAW